MSKLSLSQAKRIAIVGYAGSGKTTVAFRLKVLLGLTVYHLDEYYWKPGRRRSTREEFAKIHTGLCAEPAWIMNWFELLIPGIDTLF